MQSNFFSLKNILAVLFVACIVLMLVLYAQKYDNSIRWKVTSQAEIEEISGFNFSKGPFEFSLPAHKISIVESFSAGPIERFFETERALLILSFLGLALLLTAVTFLKGFWHYLILGLFIFFFMSLDLGSVQFLGFPTFSKMGSCCYNSCLCWSCVYFQCLLKRHGFWMAVSHLSSDWLSTNILFWGRPHFITRAVGYWLVQRACHFNDHFLFYSLLKRIFLPFYTLLPRQEQGEITRSILCSLPWFT